MKQIIALFLAAVLVLGTAPAAYAEGNESEGNAPQTEPFQATEEVTVSEEPTAEGTQPTEAPTVPETEPETAPETEPETQPENPETLPVKPVTLEIDTQHTYEGMDKAFEEGYTPKVENGKAYIVLPLIADGQLQNNELKVSLDLGSTVNSAFKIKNYEKIFQLESVKPQSSEEEQSIYFIRCEIDLSEDRYDGVYPVIVKVSGKDTIAQPVDFNFTLFVTITDGKSNEPTIPPAPADPTAEPVIYISKATVSPEKVMAGQDFALTLTLKNSLTTKSVRNLLVDVDTGNLQISLQEDSELFQIDKVDRGGETELTLHFRADPSIPAGKYNLGFNFKYDSSECLNLSSNSSTVVEIRQPANTELVMPQFPASVMVGENISTHYQVLNMGKSTLHNVRCVVSGYGLVPSKTGYIGTMNPGSSAETDIDLYIVALNTSEGYEGDQQYGATTGTVTLFYEDEFGEEFHKEMTFDTEVTRPIAEVPDVTLQEDETEQASNLWWIVILALGGVILAGAIGVFIYKRKADKKGRYL